MVMSSIPIGLFISLKEPGNASSFFIRIHVPIFCVDNIGTASYFYNFSLPYSLVCIYIFSTSNNEDNSISSSLDGDLSKSQ